MLSLNAFNDNKAGMVGLDKERIARIIAENTGSKFESHSMKRKQRIDERIKQNHEVLESLSVQAISQAQTEADAVLRVLELERDLTRIKVHIDMDAFYASVEMRDRPKLRCIPMAVGSDSMLSTSNYIARRFGVRSAMPGFIGRKLCPELVIVPCDFNKYKRDSGIIRRIFVKYDPHVRMHSLDEAYLDITEYVAKRSESVILKRVRYDGQNGNGCVCRLPLLSTTAPGKSETDLKNDVLGQENCENENLYSEHSLNLNKNKHPSECRDEHPAEKVEMENNETNENGQAIKCCSHCKKKRYPIVDQVEFRNDVDAIVSEIRFRVEQATGLTCSAGIGANWMLSKVCSDMRKPDGQFRISNEHNAIVNFMRTLPIRKVSGIGAVTEAILQGLGIETCGDLLEKRAILRILFSNLQSNWFMQIALGIHMSDSNDNNEHADSGIDRRSISIERTFSPQNNINILMNTCKQLCCGLINDCAQSQINGGKTATIKIKFASFDVITRARSASFVINSAEVLFPIVQFLLKRELTTRGFPLIRLLGVRLSRLQFIGESADDQSTVMSDIVEQRKLTDFFQNRHRKRKSSETPIEIVDLDSGPSTPELSPLPDIDTKHDDGDEKCAEENVNDPNDNDNECIVLTENEANTDDDCVIIDSYCRKTPFNTATPIPAKKSLKQLRNSKRRQTQPKAL